MLIRELREEDLLEYGMVYTNAYPGFKRPIEQIVEVLRNGFEEVHTQTLVGVDENGKIQGGFKLLDFSIYQNYNEFKMGGIGGVCVSLDAKKQGVAKQLIKEALRRMIEKDIPISILYPFRHDFYEKMGWGQVGEVKEFKFAPSSLPLYPEREFIRGYQDKDLDGIKECYERFAKSGNCTVKRTENLWNAKMKHRPNMFVYEEEGVIEGYMVIGFDRKESSPLRNDLRILEMVYTTQRAYFGLLGFIASQFDQFESVIYATRRNEPFHLLLKESRREHEIIHGLYHYSQKVGLGWMLRVIDVKKALLGRMNYNATNLDVTFIIEDSFLPENSGSYTFILNDGKPVVNQEKSKYQIKLDIATFSQLFVNYLTFTDAAKIRKLEVNDPAILACLDQAFSLPEPQMLEYF